MFKPPRALYPPSDTDLDDWTNYPDRSQKIKSNSQALFSMFCEVSRITYDLSWSLFGDGETKPTLNADFVKMTDDAYSRLKKWYEEFPGCLGVDNAAPHVLSFQSVRPF